MFPWLSQGFGQVLSVIAGQMSLLWHRDRGCDATCAFICGQRGHYEHQWQQGARVVIETNLSASTKAPKPHVLANLHSFEVVSEQDTEPFSVTLTSDLFWKDLREKRVLIKKRMWKTPFSHGLLFSTWFHYWNVWCLQNISKVKADYVQRGIILGCGLWSLAVPAAGL